MKKNLFFGYLLVICGLIILIIAALNYIFGWKHAMPPFVFGLIFLPIGIASIRKGRNNNKDI